MGQPLRQHVLKRGNGPEPETLDLHAARSEAALTILRDLYEGLMEIGPEGTPVPAAADHFEVSEDARTYRFHLRTDARWSNGETLTAGDFVASWQRLKNPKTAAQYANLLDCVAQARALDPKTLEVELHTATPHFLALLTHPASFPLHQGSLAAHRRGFAKPGVMVSNGAFVLTRWDFGSHLSAARNAAYWNAAATQLEGVEYHSLAEPTTELKAFRAGELDTTYSVPGAQLPWLKAHQAEALHIAPQLAVYYLGLNLRRAPFKDNVNLRRALSMVIDRERLVTSVTAMGEAPAYSFVPSGVAGYEPALPDYAAWPMHRRIEVARALLHGSTPPPLEMRYNSGELHSRLALAVASMWHEALGIEVTLHAEEFKVLLQDIDHGDAQVFRASWLADYDDPYSFLQVMKSDFGINLPRYASLQYDRLLGEALRATEPAAHAAALRRAEAQMLSDQPLIPLYFYVSKHLVAAHIGGWRDNAMNVVYSKELSKE